MKTLIDVFRMKELTCETRIRVIKKLGIVINHEYASNITDELVSELVKILDDEEKSTEFLND